MTISEVFAGIGGLGLGVAAVLGGRVVWQVEHDAAACAVLRARSDAVVHCADVRGVGRELGAVDILCGGFPCQDLSLAGCRAGIDGARSGLWREMVRLAGELQPALVVLENVPAVLKHEGLLRRAFAEVGYEMTWTTLGAIDVGAPHRRLRAFGVAWRGTLPAWTDYAETPWVAEAQEAVWPTPPVALRDNQGGAAGRVGPVRPSLDGAVRPWPTPMARDYRSGCDSQFQERRNGTPQLCDQIGGRLNPDWVETLMGLPVGWTDPSRDVVDAVCIDAPRWPAGMVADAPDRGPQYAWEPPRVVGGPPMRGRPARLRQIGNAVVPRQAAVALSALLTEIAATERQGRML